MASVDKLDDTNYDDSGIESDAGSTPNASPAAAQSDQGTQAPTQAQTPAATPGGQSQGGQVAQQPQGGGVAQQPSGHPFFADENALTFRSDAANNLVDAHGNVIARSGKDRAVFERAGSIYREFFDQYKGRVTATLQSAQHELSGLRSQVQNLQGQVQTAEAHNSQVKSMGLTPDEHLGGLRLMSQWKTDPLGTIQYLMSSAAAKGHDIKPLMNGQNLPDINTQAVMQQVNQTLAPFQQQQQQQQKEAEIRQRAQQETDAFYTAHSDARMHDSVLAHMITKDASLTLEAAYWKLRHSVDAHGLDWNRDIPTQLAERQAAAAQGQQQQQATLPMNGTMQQGQVNTNGQTPVMHNPGSVRGGQTGSSTYVAPGSPAATQPAGADDSWADIVNSAMKETGGF